MVYGFSGGMGAAHAQAGRNILRQGLVCCVVFFSPNGDLMFRVSFPDTDCELLGNQNKYG